MIFVKVQYPGGKEEIEGVSVFPSVGGQVKEFRIERVEDLRSRGLKTPDRLHSLDAMVWLAE